MSTSDNVKFDLDDEKLTVEDVERAITAPGYEVKKSQVKASQRQKNESCRM